MASSERPFWTSLPARILMTVVAIGILAALMIPTGGKITDDDDNDDTPPPLPVESGCTRDLKRILSGIAPGRLGINTGSEDLAVELNRWFKKCGQDIEDELTQDTEIQKQIFSEDVFKQLQEERFFPTDIEHIRVSLLAKQIVANVCGDVQETSQKVVQLFEFVSNNVILVDSTNSAVADLPATPYQTLVWGIGTAKDRAWTFATLLRQIRVDAFILTPKSKPELWLIGVSVPDVGVQLFDPRLGLPLPSGASPQSPLPSIPATLSGVQQDENLLKQLDVADYQYPLTANDFKDVKVELIGNPSLWANRVARLQYMIAPIDGVELYDGIGPNALREGSQRQRIVNAGAEDDLWQESQVEIWDYPLQQITASIEAQQDSTSTLKMFEAIFAGPQLLKLDPLTGAVMFDRETKAPLFGAARTTLHAVRIEQLRGLHQDALPHFGPILLSYKTNPSPMNEEAANVAALWIGICQMDSKRLKAAASSFHRFTTTLRQSRTQLLPMEQMQLAAFSWKALVEVQQNNIAAAIQSLKAAQATVPSHRNAYLINRWEQISKQKGEDSQ